MAEIITNPPAQAQNGLASFWSFLGGAVGDVTQTYLSGQLAKQNARDTAAVQSILNKNHELNPATGSNDPAAAQVAANRSFLEKFLPSSMLYQKDVATGQSTPSPFYYLIMAALAVAAVVLIIRLFRK